MVMPIYQPVVAATRDGERQMSEPDRVLTTLTRTQGANQALKDGTVAPAGFSLKFEEIPVLVKGFRRMVRSLEFDVSEMALTTYLTAREHGVAFTARSGTTPVRASVAPTISRAAASASTVGTPSPPASGPAASSPRSTASTSGV